MRTFAIMLSQMLFCFFLECLPFPCITVLHAILLPLEIPFWWLLFHYWPIKVQNWGGGEWKLHLTALPVTVLAQWQALIGRFKWKPSERMKDVINMSKCCEKLKEKRLDQVIWYDAQHCNYQHWPNALSFSHWKVSRQKWLTFHSTVLTCKLFIYA